MSSSIQTTIPVTNANIPNVARLRDTIGMTQERVGILYNKAPSSVSQNITKIYLDSVFSIIKKKLQ